MTVIKQPSTPQENSPVPFQDWVVAHADRIPNHTVIVDETPEEDDLLFGHNTIINRANTRFDSQPVTVNMLPTKRISPAAADEDDSDEEDSPALRFGLSKENYQNLREKWERESQERLEREKTQLQEQAYEKGYDEATAEAEQTIGELRLLFQEGLEDIQTNWASFLEQNESQMAQLAVRIAERIVNAPLPDAVYEPVNAAIHDAIDQLAGEWQTDITLHPADYLQLRESGLMEQLDKTYETLQWHSDPEVEQRGDWIVETPRAAVRHIASELLADIEQSLGINTGE